MMNIRALLTFLLLCASNTIAFDDPDTVRSYVRGGVGYANIALPDKFLQRSDLTRWETLLNLSEAQVRFMEREYDSFLARHNEVIARELPRHLELSAEASSTITNHGGMGSWETVEALDAVNRNAARIRSLLEQAERTFIHSLRPILTEEQVSHLPVLEREATRRQCRTIPNSIRWADLELRTIWNKIDPQLVTAEDATFMQHALAEYEAALTPLVCHQAETFWTRSARLARLFVKSHEGTLSSKEFLDQHAREMEAFTRISQRIASLNERTAQEIAADLSDELASVFMKHAHRTVFPELYPDRSKIHSLFDRLQDDPALDDETRSKFNALHNSYGESYSAKLASLESFCVGWSEEMTMGTNGYQLQFLADALRPKLEGRTDVSRRYLRQLHELFGSEMLVRHADAIPSALRSELAELLEAADDTGN